MKLLKPSWVTHDGKPIFSVDIHPDGTRFATGGQGDDSGRVVIWNMTPVANEEDELNENVPKVLCQLDNHLACVNCVRWSNSGKYLASGGDDKVIMIWQQTGRSGGMSSVFGSSGPVINVEHWRCISSLRGHSGDVLDLAWSYNDMWLASSSVDNNIMIWNTQKWQEIVAVLKGHTSLVKGVVWDPIGKYIASQSDDKSLRVWRTYDWQPETVVTEPFSECGGTTHILRLAWSPDGQYLVTAHAMNNSGPTAQIVERDGWKTNKDFVGHRKAITCVRFNPNILSNANKENDKIQHFCCCAIGSRDKSISIWLTYLKRPLVVIHDLFTSSVLDISWNTLGNQIIACSWDGTVAYVDFTEDEIGKSVSPEEKSQLHQKWYGKSLNNHLGSSIANIIENPEMLKLQQKAEVKQPQPPKESLPNSDCNSVENHNACSKSSDSFKSATTQLKGPIDKQIETLMPDGRRRITPLFIPPTSDGDCTNSRALPTFSSSSEKQSKIVIGRRDESQSSMPSSSMSTPPLNNGQTSFSQAPPVVAAQETSTKAEDKAPESPIKDKQEVGSSAVSENSGKPKENSMAPRASATTETPVSTIPVKRKSETVPIGRPPEKRKPGRPPSTPQSSTNNHRAPSPPIRPLTTATKDSRGEARPAGFQIPPLKIDRLHTFQVAGFSKGTNLSLEVENNIAPSPTIIVHKLKCYEPKAIDTPIWQRVFASKISGASASRNLVAVTCDDATLWLLSFKEGTSLLPPIALAAPAAKIACKNNFVMVITTLGGVSVWNLKTNQNVVKNESVASFIQGTTASLRSARLTEDGRPIVSLSNGKSYMFDGKMNCWFVISSGDNAIKQSSNFLSLSQPVHSLGHSLPLASIQPPVNGTNSKLASSHHHDSPEITQQSTAGWMDDQFKIALLLQSPVEYKYWLLELVRFLTLEGMELKLRCICDKLLGPVTQPSNKQTQWDPETLGMKKRELLKEVLAIILTNMRLQRLYTEYNELLQPKVVPSTITTTETTSYSSS